jgi:formamidopyrimidine-DNA glycosylase
MPELPEVETYVRELRPQVVGHRFTSVEVLWPRSVATPDVETFESLLVGLTVERLNRRGKYLNFGLDNGSHLLIHLKMSGRLRVESSGCSRQPHDRVLFGLTGDRQLRFNDMRKFGRVYLVAQEDFVTAALGPEPLEADFTLECFASQLKERVATIKPLLLNQTFVAGLGNIYADEVLFRARIHPQRHANRLADEEIRALYDAIQDILRQSIERQGTSFDLVYSGGIREARATYQLHLQVYGRRGQPCPNCGHLIERIIVGGRGTHVCPQCQSMGKEQGGKR